ncbi:protein-tyrosine-phosphatase [Caldisalinibacter kiritimatiensis]|uniref:Protein-tyrosine-phosphatase n=2 Tax=Caldisalinibacter kiritimatiensis TaxID=1304284 RepID=R1CHI8_9FIRM|nr:protein-tyrosine-phosphatase [Caldisalinibacter kiritimatiensis]
MAEALFKDMIEKAGKDIKGLKVASAGVCAIPNQPATAQAIHALKEEGIDLSSHRSKPLTKEMIDKADLILTMTVNHKNAVLQMTPDAKGKVFTLKEYALKDINIDEILDELGVLYSRLREKREELITRRAKEIEALKRRREKIIKELNEIENEIKEWQMQIEAELEDDKAEIMRLEKKIPELDIVDPFGKPVEEYKKSAKEIKETLTKILEKIMEEIKNN